MAIRAVEKEEGEVWDGWTGASVTGGGLPGVKLCQGALGNPLEHLFGEDTQQLPADVQGFIYCPVVVWS